MSKKTNRILLVSLVLVLAICTALTAVACNKPRHAEGNETIIIGHITDTHLFIEESCNSQSAAYKSVREGSTKFLEESVASTQVLLDKIYAMEKAPKYLFATGDLTSNAEVVAHEKLAEMFADLTAKMRKRAGYEGFQIFAIPGNHDLYNNRSWTYMPSIEELNACDNEEERISLLSNYSKSDESCTNEKFIEIYSDFGYGGSNCLAEIELFYESDYWYDDNGVGIVTPPEDVLEAYEESSHDMSIIAKYARHGATSYIARTSDITVVSFDSNSREYTGGTENPSALGWEETTGGYITNDMLKWALESIKDDVQNDKMVVALGHQNFAPHFTMEDDIFSLFTFDNWEQVAYTLADAGIRYAFSGHMHSSDIANYVSQNGNIIYDFETSSPSSYGAAIRTVKFDRSWDRKGALTENMYSNLHSSNDVLEYNVYDFTANGDVIFEEGKLKTKKVKTIDDEGNDIGLMDYMHQTQQQMIQNIVGGMLNDGLYDTIAGLGSSIGNTGMFAGVGDLITGLVDGLRNLDLVKPTFNADGTYTMPSDNAVTDGYDLIALASDVVDHFLTMDLTFKGKNFTLPYAFFSVYGGHLTGADTATMDADVALVVEACNNGTFVKTLFGTLLDVLVPQLQLIIDAPIRYSTKAAPLAVGEGFDISVAMNSASTFNILGLAKKFLFYDKVDTGMTTLADIVARIPAKINNLKSTITSLGIDESLIDTALEYVNAFVDYDKNLSTTLDNVLIDKYFTEAFYCNLGNYVGQIVESLGSDSSDDGSYFNDNEGYNVTNIADFHVRYSADTFGGNTYYRDAKGNGSVATCPTVENGLLPSMITLSYGEDPTEDIIVQWFTNINIDPFDPDKQHKSEIKYWKEGKKEKRADTSSCTGENIWWELPTIDLGLTYINLTYSYKLYNRYSVELDLDECTKYYYRVGSDEYGWSDVYSFTTAKTGEGFTVLGITDIQGSVADNYSLSAQNMQKALAMVSNPAFIISCGDNVDDGDSVFQWQWLLNYQRSVWANNVIVTATGNHEDEDYSISSKVAVPSDATVLDTGEYYSYDYMNTHFVVLNTNDLSENNDLRASQISWLEEDLAQANADSGIDFIVVVMHKGPYTAGSHAFDSDVIAIRAQLTPLFVEYNVDLVLQGHDHTYSLSEYILADKSVETVTYEGGAAIDPKGVLYMNLGTIGDKFYKYIYSPEVSLVDRSNAPSRLAKYIKDGNLEITSNETFIKLNVTGKTLTLTSYLIEDDGNVIEIDNVIIKK